MIGSLISGMIGQGGANAAAGMAQNAGQNATSAGWTAWNNAQGTALRNQRAAAPYTSAGYAATNELLRAMGLGHLNPMSTGEFSYGDTSLNQDDRAGDRTAALNAFQTSPGYQWRVSEGTKALDRSAASRGMLLSGAQAKAVTDYNQNQASNEWGNYINMLAGVSGQGASATANVNNANTSALNAGNNALLSGQIAGSNLAAKAGDFYKQGADALASGIGHGFENLLSFAKFNPYRMFGNI